MIRSRWEQTQTRVKPGGFFFDGYRCYIVHDCVGGGIWIGARARLYHVPGANCEGLRYFS